MNERLYRTIVQRVLPSTRPAFSATLTSSVSHRPDGESPAMMRPVSLAFALCLVYISYVLFKFPTGGVQDLGPAGAAGPC